MQLYQNLQKQFSNISNGKTSFKNISQKGMFIQHLLRLSYFKNISNQFGISQLLLYLSLHMLQFYILRQGKELIDESCQFVFISGKINFHGINCGEVIDISKTGDCRALEDCYFIQIKKNNKNWRIVKEAQVKKHAILNTYERKLQFDQQKHSVFEYIKNIQYFNSLSHFDLVELAVSSRIKIENKHTKIINFKQQICQIGFIIQGQVRLSSPIQVQATKDDLIKKYKLNFHQTKKLQLTKVISKNQWIGLQELFSQYQLAYLSDGSVVSKQAKILLIPIKQFNQKFNLTVCYQTISKMKGLVISKKKIKQQSLQAQNMLKVNNEVKSNIKPLLLQKIKNYDSRRQLSQSKRFSSQIKKIQTLEFVPQTIMHKFNQAKSKSSLQINQQRLNLFPQQYEESFVCPNERRQIDLAKQKKDRDQMKYLSPRDHKLACKSKQKLHQEASSQNILFSLTRKSTQNYIMQSTFYKSHEDNYKYSNLNNKTIQLLQVDQSKKTISKKKSKDNFLLPYLLSNKGSTLNIDILMRPTQMMNLKRRVVFNSSKHEAGMHSTIQNSLPTSRSKILSKYKLEDSKSKQKVQTSRKYLHID